MKKLFRLSYKVREWCNEISKKVPIIRFVYELLLFEKFIFLVIRSIFYLLKYFKVDVLINKKYINPFLEKIIYKKINKESLILKIILCLSNIVIFYTVSYLIINKIFPYLGIDIIFCENSSNLKKTLIVILIFIIFLYYILTIFQNNTIKTTIQKIAKLFFSLTVIVLAISIRIYIFSKITNKSNFITIPFFFTIKKFYWTNNELMQVLEKLLHDLYYIENDVFLKNLLSNLICDNEQKIKIFSKCLNPEDLHINLLIYLKIFYKIGDNINFKHKNYFDYFSDLFITDNFLLLFENFVSISIIAVCFTYLIRCSKQ